ncbi:hypothetical protein K439DRAFT_1630845 [Ramaria rubella]|nr:hypothetical protein K439DRAFT_1630845 [Ramaria rubella]
MPFLPILALISLSHVLCTSLGDALASSPSTAHNVSTKYATGYAADAADWVGNISTDPFYQSPSYIDNYAAGSPIRIESVSKDTLLTEYQVPPGLTLYRLLYQSVDLDDKLVPASAFILLPYARSSPRTPLNVIAWAHGTAGIERQCAPSNTRDLYYNFEGPFAMALRGYAVIAPDFAGLGSDTTFNYLAGPSHAADVAYSVVAARQAFPPGLLTHEWVVVGHSEGGLTAWATNERELERPIGGFLGAVAIAPALQNLHIIRYGIAHNSLATSSFYSSYTLTTIARLNNSVDVTQYFSDLGQELSRLAATACFNTAAAIFANVTFADIFRDQSWLNSSWAIAWENRTGVRGDNPLVQPLLLIEGLGDRSVFPPIQDSVFAHHCARHPKTRVHLSRYPDSDHDPVAFVSQLEYFNWIEDRFNGADVPYGCTNTTIETIYEELGLASN